jgi:hypothetical protein
VIRLRAVKIGVPIAVLLLAAVAFAYWATTGSGSASGSVDTLNAPVISAPSTSTGSTTITWTSQASFGVHSSLNGSITYRVDRKLGSGSFAPIASGPCSGSLPNPTTSCTDTVTASGSYKYQVVAIYNSWTATSNTQTVDVATPPPAPTVSGTIPASPAQSTTPAVYGSGAAAGSTVKIYTDSSCTTQVGSGTAANFNSSSTGVTISTPVGANSTTTFYATATDASNNASPCSTTSTTYVTDNTNPDVPTFTIPAFIKNGQTLTATSVNDNSGGSGVAKVEYLYCSGTSCTPNILIGQSTDSSSNYQVTWSSQPADGDNYRVMARVTDNAGNTRSSTVQSTQIDNTNPNVPPFTPPAFMKNGVSLTSVATDNSGGSGIQQVEYFYCAGTSCTPNISIGSSTASAGNFAVTWNSQPADGNYQLMARATDKAGNTRSSTVQSTQIDNTSPDVPTFTIPAFIKNGQSLTATSVNDNAGGSGVSKVEYFYCAGTSCTPSTSIGSSTTAAGNYPITWNSQPADGSYQVLARVTDKAGNTRDSATRSTFIENTPQASAISTTASGDNKPGNGDTITITFNEPMDEHSICATWPTGGPTTTITGVTVSINQASPRDTLSIGGTPCTGSTAFNFGSLDLGDNSYVSSTQTETGNVSYDSSTNKLTISITSTAAGVSAVTGSKTITYTPSASILARSGQAISTSVKPTQTSTANW